MTKVSKKATDKKQVLSPVELAKLVANKHLSKTTSRGKSTNDYLVDILLDKEPLTRPEIVERVLATKFEAKLEAIATEAKDQDEAIEMAQKLYKTAKNSVDTSLSNSNNNSSFSYNKAYEHLELIKVDGKYSIVKRAK